MVFVAHIYLLYIWPALNWSCTSIWVQEVYFNDIFKANILKILNGLVAQISFELAEVKLFTFISIILITSRRPEILLTCTLFMGTLMIRCFNSVLSYHFHTETLYPYLSLNFLWGITILKKIGSPNLFFVALGNPEL